MKHYNETDKAVADYLKSIGVNFSASYQGESVEKGTDGATWQRDSFTVKFWRGKSNIVTAYHMGIGHRVKTNLNGLGAEAEQAGTSMPKFLEYDRKSGELSGRKVYVKMPSPAGVLYSLLSDARLGEDLFADFCGERGYDEDSRKALAMYEACQKTAIELRMLTGAERAKLNELLEDY